MRFFLFLAVAVFATKPRVLPVPEQHAEILQMLLTKLADGFVRGTGALTDVGAENVAVDLAGKLQNSNGDGHAMMHFASLVLGVDLGLVKGSDEFLGIFGTARKEIVEAVGKGNAWGRRVEKDAKKLFADFQK